MNESLKVLVVDDLETMRKVTAGQLASLGINHVELARDGAEALKLLASKRFDVVISDWNMPVMTGIELLRAMRDLPRHASTPFVMITAEAERGRIEEAIRCGVSDLLVKPYTAERLSNSLRKALQRQRRRMSPAAQIPVAAAIPAEAALSEKPTALRTAPKPATLLLVDDTADNLHLLADIFKSSYRVRAAHNGQKALDICCTDNPPDLVLLDVMMPGIDGFEVARRLREQPQTECVPIIFVTALNDKEAQRKGMELGAVDFVSKPIDPVLLKLRVDNFMRYVELRRQLQADYDNMLDIARLRDDVEAITRHDLKGPLAALIGIVQALLGDDDLSRRQIEQLRLGEQAALQVMDMVSLSTELYKIETGRFTLQASATPIGELLRRIVEMARVTFAGKQLTIAVDTDVDLAEGVPHVLCDAMLTHSLFSNLIRNACEAAPEQSRVLVALVGIDPIRVEIVNKGIIPLDIRDHFFDKFVTHGKPGGTGLGSYSARLLARAQTGDVCFTVDDAANQTTLTVTLPAAPKDARSN